MTPDQLQEVIEALKGTVVETVNGKIDRIDKKLDAHIDEHRADTAEIKGFLELTRGARVLGEIGKWVGSVAVFGFIIKWLFLKQ